MRKPVCVNDHLGIRNEIDPGDGSVVESPVGHPSALVVFGTPDQTGDLVHKLIDKVTVNHHGHTIFGVCMTVLYVIYHCFHANQKDRLGLKGPVVPTFINEGVGKLELGETFTKIPWPWTGQTRLGAVIALLVNATSFENVRVSNNRQTTAFGNILGREYGACHQAAIEMGKSEAQRIRGGVWMALGLTR